MREAGARQPVARGSTESERILERGPFRLLHYLPPPPTAGDARLPPVVLVYSLINRPDLLDLSPRRSLVKDLLRGGFPVYLVDWGYPLEADRLLELEDYTPGFLSEALDLVTSRHHHKPVLAGICQGGTLSICQACLDPESLSLLVTIGTPVDFHAGASVLGSLATAWPSPTDASEPVGGHRLSAAFTALRPVDLLIRRYQQLPELASAPQALEDFLRMEAWMYDCPDQPGRVFHRFLQDFYLHNRLFRGTLRLAGAPVRLDALTVPVLNIFATDDHLVPPESAGALEQHIPASRYHETQLPGGHLGMFLSKHCREQIVLGMQETLAYL